jgi:MoxR-like ATPase
MPLPVEIHPETLPILEVCQNGDTTLRTLPEVRALCKGLGDRCRGSVQGRDDVIVLVLTALFADGHVLLEDHPGSGKTTLAKALGQSITATVDAAIAPFRRIQFTPDLLPSDVTGTTLYDAEAHRFVFRHGPIFANVVLVDEINRTSPKVQAALLEGMAEKQVTVDNHTHLLHELFFVIATQNPLDLAGTYPLPQAQLDRFLFKIKMTYLSRDSELDVLARRSARRSAAAAFSATPEAIVQARRVIQAEVAVHPAIHECLVSVAGTLRKDRRVALGISTRSLVQAVPALQTRAMMQGRDYVSPRDLKALAVPLFAHRLVLAPGSKDAELVVTEAVAPIVEAMTRRTLAAS